MRSNKGHRVSLYPRVDAEDKGVNDSFTVRSELKRGQTYISKVANCDIRDFQRSQSKLMTFFVGKDVAEALGYERLTKAVCDHVDEDDKDAVPIQDSIGRMIGGETQSYFGIALVHSSG